jgi:hypothetical protein
MRMTMMMEDPTSSSDASCFDDTLPFFFTEHATGCDAVESEVRALAHGHMLPLTTVEKVRTMFEAVDTDKSGYIEFSEFQGIIENAYRRTVKVPGSVLELSKRRLEALWKEIDVNGSNAVSFEEFLLWYVHTVEAEESVLGIHEGSSFLRALFAVSGIRRRLDEPTDEDEIT